LTGFKGLIGLRIFTVTSLRQGYGGQEERKERREKIVQSMNPILKILFILSKTLFRDFRVFRGQKIEVIDMALRQLKQGVCS